MLQRRRHVRFSRELAAFAAPLLFTLTGCDELLGLDELAKEPCAGPCVDGAVVPDPAAASTSETAGSNGASEADAAALRPPGDAEPAGLDGGPAPRCGDGTCDPSESCASCAADCSECPRPPSGITDGFDGTGVNTLVWSPWNNTGATVATRNGALEITPGVVPAYAGVTSVAALDVTGRETRLEVRQVAGPKGQLETYIQLTPRGGQDHLRMGVSAGSFVFSKQVGSVSTNTSAPYDAVAMRWWRLWERAGTTYGDYAPDSRGPWTQFASAPNPFPMTGVELLLASGSYGATVTPGVAVFDNVNK